MRFVMTVVLFTCFSFTVLGEDLSASVAVAHEDMVVVGETVHSSGIEWNDASIATVLASVPGVDLRVQGVTGGQCDLSIRGSSFSGAGISLNGMALPNAQTEHFNIDLPIASGLLSAPVIYTGFDQSIAGDAHLIGTVDFSILPVNTARSLTLGISEKEGYWANALMQQRQAVKDGFIGIGAFGETLEANAVDYPDNDFSSRRAGGQIQWIGDSGQWDFIIARQTKSFGARGYYGATPDWPADEDTEDTLLFVDWSKSDEEGNRTRASAMYREQIDEYTLAWTLPGTYSNNHSLTTYGGSVDGRWLADNGGMLDWRITASEERIRSTGLGDHERAQMGLAAVPGIQFGKWKIQAGTRFEIFEETLNKFLPQAAVEYRLKEGLKLKLAYSESVRQPSYTELNYESPASLGNAGLGNQRCSTTELRMEGNSGSGLLWQIGVFDQTTWDTVDWIREQETSQRWEAKNIGIVDTAGVEAGVRWHSRAGSRLALQYTGLVKNTDTEIYSSRYALDYPEHLLQFSGLLALGSRCALELLQNIRRQDENPLRESSTTGYDASLTMHIVALKNPRVQFALSINNLWDDDFEVFPGQATVTPQRFSAGVTTEW